MYMTVVKPLVLSEVDEEKIDVVLTLPDPAKIEFFGQMISQFFPHAMEDEKKFAELQRAYRDCWMMEKLYRNNIFLKESFTIVYTQTGLIRNIWMDMYYTDDDLIIR